jgi:hypothetical protein
VTRSRVPREKSARTRPQVGNEVRACRRRSARFDQRPPVGGHSVPDEEALRDLWTATPGYQLLVTYLRWFQLELPGLVRRLPASDQEAIARIARARDRDREDKLLARQRAQEESNLERLLRPRRRYRPPSMEPSLTLLTVGWLLMDRENGNARSNAAIRAFVQTIASFWGVPAQDIFLLSYVPRRVLGLLEVRLSQLEERRQSRALHRRPPREQERDWWERLGFDKASSSLQRQEVWSRIFPRLINALRGDSAAALESSKARAYRDASTLIHLRYPTLWPDKPEVVRKKFERSPASSGVVRPPSR